MCMGEFLVFYNSGYSLVWLTNKELHTVSVYWISQHSNIASVLYAVGRRFESRLKKRISITGLSSALKTRSHKSRKSSVGFVMSVRLSACSSAGPTGRIFVKFYIGKSVDRLQIWLKSDKVSHTLRDDVSYVYIFHNIMKYFISRQHCKGNRFSHFLLVPVNTSVLLTATYSQQQYKNNVLLRFHGNSCYKNVPQKRYNTFNILLTVHHAIILGKCPTWRTNSFQYIYL